MSDHLCTEKLKEYYPATMFGKDRIGIMGGTFDPVHYGHIQMGIDAHDQFALSKVLYIPTGRPPHKDGKFIAKDQHRLAMLDIALPLPYMQISSMEVDRRGTTYAIDTLNTLKNIFQDHEFYYIIGSDTLLTLDQWKHIDQVLTMTCFIVFLRKGDHIDEVNRVIDFYNSPAHQCVVLAETPGLPVSSTEIRFRIMNGLDVSGFLPDNVIDYIKENNVYTK